MGDWGTTNLRAWVVAQDGVVLNRADFPLGVSALAPGEAAERFETEVRPTLGAADLPAMLCGMIGSTLGWVTAPYLDCPTSLTGLARALVTAAPNVKILPGLACQGLAGPDVMRGEETQILGWLAADAAHRRGRHVLCLPGTHAKWVEVEDGNILRFVTAMTGELFAVLTRHSILRTEAPADDPAAFDEGVKAAGDGSALSARLFSARSRIVTGLAPASAAASYLSGMLIGSEVASLSPLFSGGPVALIGDAGLCRAYQNALKIAGRPSSRTDGDTAVLAGLTSLWRQTTELTN